MPQQVRERYHYIHNVFANFFKDMMDYFTYLYPRFEYSVMGTYDKAVEYLNKQCDYGRETDQPMLPALIVNPLGEFTPADSNAGGRQYWRYPNLNPTLIKRLFTPLYRDANVLVNAGFMRMKGEIELIMLLNSFYEYCDLRMLFFNMFGGLDRIIYPQFFTSFIILPDSFINFQYTNEYTGLTYDIDWSGANASNHLVRSTARNELVLPLNIKPQIALTSISDASTRYGGTDKLADWRLGATISYEMEIPNYLIIESDYLAENVNLEIRYGSAFSAYDGSDVPINRQLINYQWDWGLDETSQSQLVLNPDDATCEITLDIDLIWKTRYFWPITESEASSTTNVQIAIPEQITWPRILIVNSKYGPLNFGDHYVLVDNGNTLEIKVENVNLEEGMIIELHIYEDMAFDADVEFDLRVTAAGRDRTTTDGFPRYVKVRL